MYVIRQQQKRETISRKRLKAVFRLIGTRGYLSLLCRTRARGRDWFYRLIWDSTQGICFLDRPCLQHAATSMFNKIMLQHTASYRNMLAALKHAATLVTLMIRQRTFICVANRGVVTKEASQGIKRNWSCVCIARLRYAANLQACSLYERDLDIIIHLPFGFFPINIIVSLWKGAPSCLHPAMSSHRSDTGSTQKQVTYISFFTAFTLLLPGRAGERHLFLSA